MTQFYAYLHCKPDGIPFYVGKGHGKRSHDFVDRKNQHHKNIVEKYGAHNIVVWQFDCTDENSAFTLEKYLIAHYRRIGMKLCNLTDGGEGTKGLKHSLESNLRKSVVMKGKKNCLGYKHTNETKAKMAASSKGNRYRLGKKDSEETRIKKSQANLGKIKSPETCAKISASKKGKSNGLVGKRLTPEHRAKLLGNQNARKAIII